MADRDAQVAAVAALAEPTRRRLYEHVVPAHRVRRADDVFVEPAAGRLGKSGDRGHLGILVGHAPILELTLTIEKR